MANLSSTRVFGDASVERSLYVKQRLGVGVGNPSERIEVGGESYPQIRFDTSDGNSTIWNVGFAGDYAFQIRNQNTSDTHVTVNPGGNVGINTTSPSYQLDVNGDINAQNTLRSSGNVVSPDNDPDAHHAVFEPADYTPVSDVEAHGNALVIDITGDADSVDGYEGSDLAALAENETFTNGLNITRGNVGIGTDSPDEALSFDKVTGEKIALFNNNDGYRIGVETGELRFAGGPQGSDNISFFTQGYSGTERMTIGGGGNVGIGTDSPDAPLTVQGTGTDSAMAKYYNGSGNELLRFTNDGGGNFGTTIFMLGNNTSKSKAFIWRVGDEGSNGANLTLGDTNNQDENLYFVMRQGGSNSNAMKIDTNNDVHGNSGLTVGSSYFSTTPPSNGAIIEGNVGIGTDSPNGKLDIQQDGNTGQEAIRILRPDGTVSGKLLDYQGDFSFEGSNGSDFRIGIPGSGSAEITVEDTGATTFDRAGSEVMRLNDNGNVGIGTTSPAATLDVNGLEVDYNVIYQNKDNSPLYMKSNGDIYYQLDANGSNYQWYWDGANGNLVNDSGSTIMMNSNGSVESVNNLNVSSIDSNNGDAAVNVDQPFDFTGNGGNNEGWELRVQGAGLEANTQRIYGQRSPTQYNNGENVSLEIDVSSSTSIQVNGGTAPYRINVQDGSGRVHHRWNAYWDGTDERFDVGGEGASYMEMNGGQFRFKTSQTNGNSGDAISWDQVEIDSGNVYADSDVIAYYSSDRRLKTNHTEIRNPISKINQLTGVGFDWKKDSPRTGSGFGVFAQDAKKIDERLIRKQGDGYLGLDYQQLHAFEIEALKQINEDVKENQSRIQKLENKVEQLQNKINQLKE